MRAVRRVVVKQFGSTRNFFVWFVAVSLSVYFIDSFILTKDRLQILLSGTKSETVSQKVDSHEIALTASTKKDDVKVESIVKTDVKAEVKVETAKAKPKCGLAQDCPADKVAFLLESGYGRDGSPVICFNGKYVLNSENKKGHRGLNVATINDKTMEIEDFRYFDTYVEEEALVRYFSLGVTDSKIILIASLDEASTGLKATAKQWLYQFGSTLVEKLGFRDSFVMVGQRGLTRGTAIEKLTGRDGKEFADVASVSGCLSVPMGKLNPIVPVKDAPKLPVPGEELPNCGVTESCGEKEFPVHIYSGKGNSELLKICVGGKYVMAKGINEAGRGFNVVVIDPNTKEVIRVGHFDTYAEDSSNLEIFLELLNEKDIIVAVTNDEASKRLSDHAKQLLNKLGGGLIQNLKFRDTWYFVGQKGIEGFTEFEQLEFAGPPGSWPKPIDKRYCIPTTIKGTKVIPDKLPHRNEKKRNFCSKFDGYGEFCTTEHIDEPLTPAPLADKLLENHPIFRVPIVVIPGLNHNTFRLQLEALLLNPGIRPDMVNVMYDEKFEEPAELASVFGFNSTKLDSSTKYIYQMHKALDRIWEINKMTSTIIVLEEEVLPSQDFLCFFAQCMTVLGDKSIAGCSAWNPNGYKETSGATDLAYRIESFPGYGFMLKKSFYETEMKGKLTKCCNTRAWDSWIVGENNYEIVVPDVSRVYRRPYEGLSEQASYLSELFNRDRLTSSSSKCEKFNFKLISNYEEHIGNLIKSSAALDVRNAADCLSGKGLGFYIPATSNKIYSIYYDQETKDDFHVLSKLCKCFKLFHQPGQKPQGIHKGILRFFYNQNQIIFIGSRSPYFELKAAQTNIVSEKQH